ncbi:MAG: ABC transporter ATP-binding protein [Clostridiaceae bacterium]|nr:ABC transporter ATP-binding protein [Clostridiaceae bacterium]
MDIQAEQLRITLGDSEILKGVDFAAQGKQLVGIIGPNGSGKSTLLKCLYRVLKPNEGLVQLDGKKLEQWSPRESAKRIAVVAQHNYYNFEFSVQDVVLMGRAPHKRALDRDTVEDYEIVHRSLETVGMAGFEDRSFATLSGGEQQRVILARALTQDTPCLILDEPTNHLDIKYQLELMELVKRLDRTVISAIHDLNIAAMYCDQLIALQNGRVVGSGTPQQLLTPSFIQEVYGVRAEVMQRPDHTPYILFYPNEEGV